MLSFVLIAVQIFECSGPRRILYLFNMRGWPEKVEIPVLESERDGKTKFSVWAVCARAESKCIAILLTYSIQIEGKCVRFETFKFMALCSLLGVC
jgi:hypothetical protein